jgi:hypothetical protein
MLLKSQYEANRKDLDEIGRLVVFIRSELEANDRHVLSLGSLKRLEGIGKVARRIHSRMRRS